MAAAHASVAGRSHGTHGKPAPGERRASQPAIASLFVLWIAGATAWAETPSRQAIASGSGVAIGTQGEILTNNHVIENCPNITVRRSSAYVVARDEQNDLAVIRSRINFRTVIVFRENPVRPGDTVVAMGYPLADRLAAEAANLSVGNVSALAGIHGDSRYLQISPPSNLATVEGRYLTRVPILLELSQPSSRLKARMIVQRT